MPSENSEKDFLQEAESVLVTLLKVTIMMLLLDVCQDIWDGISLGKYRSLENRYLHLGQQSHAPGSHWIPEKTLTQTIKRCHSQNILKVHISFHGLLIFFCWISQRLDQRQMSVFQTSNVRRDGSLGIQFYRHLRNRTHSLNTPMNSEGFRYFLVIFYLNQSFTMCSILHELMKFLYHFNSISCGFAIYNSQSSLLRGPPHLYSKTAQKCHYVTPIPS